jgi:single-strand DNA-binding protein
MANLNKVMLIGRLTRDPETRSFATGGKVANFGFAVNNRRKNASTGDWEDEPVFLDIEVFNRGDTNKLADRVEQTLRKGQQIFIEGHLRFDQWTGQDGQKRSKIKVRMDNFQYLDPRADGGGGEGGSRYSASAPAARKPAAPAAYQGEPDAAEPADARSDEEIPF